MFVDISFVIFNSDFSKEYEVGKFWYSGKCVFLKNGMKYLLGKIKGQTFWKYGHPTGGKH